MSDRVLIHILNALRFGFFFVGKFKIIDLIFNSYRKYLDFKSVLKIYIFLGNIQFIFNILIPTVIEVISFIF